MLEEATAHPLTQLEPLGTTELIRRLEAFRSEELHLRYHLGRVVHRCRYDDSLDRGQRTIAQLVAASGVAASTLRRFARVSAAIKPGDFCDILRLRGPAGLPLSWSHIEELAECRNHRFRFECAEEAITRALSVKQLRLHIRLIHRPPG
jgi:hypothetical protein